MTYKAIILKMSKLRAYWDSRYMLGICYKRRGVKTEISRSYRDNPPWRMEDNGHYH